MCDACTKTYEEVAKRLDLEPDEVKYLSDLLTSTHDRITAEEGEPTKKDVDELRSAMESGNVRPELLGTEPFIYITFKPHPDRPTTILTGIEIGGGVLREAVPDLLNLAREAVEIGPTGGMTETGNMIEVLYLSKPMRS
jgi:hypothetical protein